MASAREVQMVLEEALNKEKEAEQLCNQILEELQANGFTKIIETIKNDEIRHQKLVTTLIEMLGYEQTSSNQ